jgi:hypothetical protein
MNAEQKNSAEIEAREGVVAFFDILGFENYLRNDPEVRSKEALQILLGIKEEGPKWVKKRLSYQFLDSVRWNTFSDTILLTIPYPNDGEKIEKRKKECWLAILMSSVVLMKRMFDYGLPVRGAVSFGKFFIHEKEPLFAGAPFFYAHSLAGKLNLSATALDALATKEVRDRFPEYFKPDKGVYLAMHLLNYLTPLKDSHEKMLILNQWALHDDLDNHDIAQLVAETFWKHGKDIDEKAAQKMRNTEMLLRYLISVKRHIRSGRKSNAIPYL